MRHRLIILAVLVAATGLSSGCRTWTKNNQEHGFRIGTDVSFYSKASKTSDEKSETGIESTVLDKLLDEAEDPAPTGEGG